MMMVLKLKREGDDDGCVMSELSELIGKIVLIERGEEIADGIIL
jgi:hypothetical protein